MENKNINKDKTKVVERIRSKISLKDRLFTHNFEYLFYLHENFEEYKNDIGSLVELAHKLSEEQIITINKYKIEEENKKQTQSLNCTISSDELREKMCEEVFGMCSKCEFKL